MNNKQFIEDCKRRTPTARINTGTGKMLGEALVRIVELEAELATVKESLTTANATIDKLRDAIKGVGQFDVTGYCHMCDKYKMHNEECPHTVSALAAGGGK